jgi:hypothetical protein
VRIRLLLDVHISPEVAGALKRKFPGLDVTSIHETDWSALGDEVLLELLDLENRVLVTRDVRTIPGHTKDRIADGKTFAGVIYVDSKRHRQNDERGLIRRLIEVLPRVGDEDFTCRSRWL